jgi:catalase-peroxidase
MKFDPAYKAIAQRFVANPDEYQKAFAKAWYKLTHRDMGPEALYLGAEVPSEELIWQDPIPMGKKLSNRAINRLKKDILATDLTVSELVATAWASASTFRASDKRGGANGARIALAPQQGWAANNPKQLAQVLAKLNQVRSNFGDNKVSLADLIVLGGAAAIEQAAKAGGVTVVVPFISGRGDATQAQTDVNSFSLLEPKADAFRNYFNVDEAYSSPAENLVDKADLLGLTVPETVVLVGGMRTLNTNTDGTSHGVFTATPDILTNDFFCQFAGYGHQMAEISC